MFDDLLDKLTDRPLETAGVAGAVVGCGALLVVAVLGFFSRMSHDDLALTAAVMALLLPVVAVSGYKAGKAVERERLDAKIEAAEASAYQAARLSERLKAQHEIDRLEASHAERGDAFLKGAEKGLGIVEKVTTAKAAAHAARAAVVLPASGAPQIEWRTVDAEVIDL